MNRTSSTLPQTRTWNTYLAQSSREDSQCPLLTTLKPTSSILSTHPPSFNYCHWLDIGDIGEVAVLWRLFCQSGRFVGGRKITEDEVVLPDCDISCESEPRRWTCDESKEKTKEKKWFRFPWEDFLLPTQSPSQQAFVKQNALEKQS